MYEVINQLNIVEEDEFEESPFLQPRGSNVDVKKMVSEERLAYASQRRIMILVCLSEELREKW